MKKAPRGSGGRLPWKIFENLHTVVAILLLFEQFIGKFCLNFLPLNLSVLPNMMQFVRTFSIIHAHGVSAYCYRKGLKLWKKIVFIKSMFENGW